jgi:hypothetical protein
VLRPWSAALRSCVSNSTSWPDWRRRRPSAAAPVSPAGPASPAGSPRVGRRRCTRRPARPSPPPDRARTAAGQPPAQRIDRLASLPNHPGVIHPQALDEHRARVGVQDHGELRVQASGGGTRSVRPAHACLDRKPHGLLELFPVGMAHAPPAKGRGGYRVSSRNSRSRRCEI